MYKNKNQLKTLTESGVGDTHSPPTEETANGRQVDEPAMEIAVSMKMSPKKFRTMAHLKTVAAPLDTFMNAKNPNRPVTMTEIMGRPFFVQ